ncbi:MAG: four helix bundle protein [Desulfuromonadaceae bacterium]|nr:four helix bundle protein [Desulfuromonadaceae bacterium]
MVRTHRDLEVWRKAIDFVTVIYGTTGLFPKSEIYGLTSQIRRSVVSIPSNIAEGATRKNKTEFKQFLYIALSSAAELETQLTISENLGYLQENEIISLTDELNTISRMIQGLIKSISRSVTGD